MDIVTINLDEKRKKFGNKSKPQWYDKELMSKRQSSITAALDQARATIEAPQTFTIQKRSRRSDLSTIQNSPSSFDLREFKSRNFFDQNIAH